MPVCDRCGINAPETHELRAVTFDTQLRLHNYASGHVIDGQRIMLCGPAGNDCRGQFVTFLMTPGATKEGKQHATAAR